MILCREEFAKAVDKSVFPGNQGGPLMHIIAAKAVCFGEALKPGFADYQRRIVENSKAFAASLRAEGFDLVTGGTDNHLCLLDLRSFGITGKEFESRLDAIHITANKNAIPNDPQSPFITSGLRVGTPAVTTRGFTPEDMALVARLMRLTAEAPEENDAFCREKVAELCRKHPLYDR